MRELHTLSTTAGVSYQDNRGLFFWKSDGGWTPDWDWLSGLSLNIDLALDALEFA